MADREDNKKDSVTIAPQVFALMAAHAASHPTSAVHGILIGSRKGDKVVVADAYPVCHDNPTKPLVETALSLIQSILEENNKDNHTIVGWFTAPELLHETKPGPVALRIISNIAAAGGDDVQSMKASQGIQAFGKDFGMQWMEPIENLTVTDESKTTKAVASILEEENDMRAVKDLVDHWEEGAASEWTSASSLASFSKRYS